MANTRWRHPLTSIALALALLGTLAPPLPAVAAAGDTTADRVLGQADMSHGSLNAGSGSVGGVGLDTADGVVVDPRSGRLYVSDFANNRVLGWPDSAAFSNGQAADLVLGQASFTAHASNRGGAPSALTLSSPAAVAVDNRTGNLFISDYGNHRILVYAAPVTSGQAASLVFGQGGSFTTGTANKGGISAHSLNGPRGLAVDDAGYLYVADSLNNRVLIFAHDGDVSADYVTGQNNHFNTNMANAGSGTVNASGFDNPFALAVLGGIGGGIQNTTLAVADANNNRVLVFKPATIPIASAVYGQGGSFSAHSVNNGGASANSLNDPRGVAIDSAESLYVADFGNHRVLRYAFIGNVDTTADSVLGQAGSFTTTVLNKGGTISANTLYHPVALTVDPGQNLIVVDRDNSRVLRFDRPQNFPPLSLGITLSPDTVAVGGPGFNLLITSGSAGGFVKGTVVRWNGANRPTTFISPQFVVAAISASDISTQSSGDVTVINPGPGGGSQDTSIALYFGLRHDQQADAELGQPDFAQTYPDTVSLGYVSARGLGGGVAATAVDPHTGRLYVADSTHNRVLSWPSAAAFSNAQPADRVLGQLDLFCVEAGAGSAGLHTPQGLALDAAGNLYVADSLNNRVLEFDAPATNDAVADRVFGQATLTGTTANYSGVNALGLAQPRAVALDSAGNLFVSDSINSRVLIFDAPLTSDAVADQVLGQVGFNANLPNRGNADASAVSLAAPVQIAFDEAGRLYLADFSNNRVLVYPAGASTGAAASAVFGQPNLTSKAANNPALGPNSLYAPLGVAVDPDGNVNISDAGNNRVLEYDNPFGPGGNFSADRVFGQPNFTTNTSNASDAASETSLSQPKMIALDAQGDLLVADGGNARVLQYLTPVEPKLRLYLPLAQR